MAWFTKASNWHLAPSTQEDETSFPWCIKKKKKKRCHINDFCMLDKTKAGDKSRGSFLFFFPSYTLPTFSLFSLAIPQLMPPKKKCGPA